MQASTSQHFPDNARRALADASLQQALGHVRVNFVERRARAAARLPEFDALRDAARDIKDHVLANLDVYLERFADKVTEAGGQVHWCADADAARAAVLEICRAAGARTVTKGKTMIGEEIGLNEHLETNGIVPVETDLGEYIIQLRRESPSHLIAPAIHVNKEQVADAFRAAHLGLDPARPLTEPSALLAEARAALRDRFLAADVGVTGANFLIAETGSTVIVTNEGNGDLTQTLPRVHIVLASLEKVVPTLEDATTILRVLARSATGQEFSVYTTFSTGPRRAADRDGPQAFHVVLLDNGRSRMLGTEFQDMLRCIRCGACLNHCPVYQAVGGHAYGWVYSGPMGAVLTPALIGLAASRHLPNASTLCGRCESVCPMRIPLPRMLRRWRELEFERRLGPASYRFGLRLWAFLARRPALYRAALGLPLRLLGRLGRRRGRFRALPLAGGWTAHRDLPAPHGRTFQELWAACLREAEAASLRRRQARR
ncbi:MAG TPA: LutB/LldF family L-lactate oxidation iron-sulfur protein [Dongiaceae bacterium]|nr:LutB/LldF family L-lactate oxidation iron-sulfur protein [Dongiaceae bacterium]